MINSMGRSFKENMYKGGALGPPKKSLEKASQQLVIFHKSLLLLLLALSSDPWVQLEPKQQANIHLK